MYINPFSSQSTHKKIPTKTSNMWLERQTCQGQKGGQREPHNIKVRGWGGVGWGRHQGRGNYIKAVRSCTKVGERLFFSSRFYQPITTNGFICSVCACHMRVCVCGGGGGGGGGGKTCMQIVYACVLVSSCACVHMCVCACVCVCVCACVSACICVHACMRACI